MFWSYFSCGVIQVFCTCMNTHYLLRHLPPTIIEYSNDNSLSQYTNELPMTLCWLNSCPYPARPKQSVRTLLSKRFWRLEAKMRWGYVWNFFDKPTFRFWLSYPPNKLAKVREALFTGHTVLVGPSEPRTIWNGRWTVIRVTRSKLVVSKTSFLRGLFLFCPVFWTAGFRP